VQQPQGAHRAGRNVSKHERISDDDLSSMLLALSVHSSGLDTKCDELKKATLKVHWKRCGFAVRESFARTIVSLVMHNRLWCVWPSKR
jgi:hypothetical protein